MIELKLNTRNLSMMMNETEYIAKVVEITKRYEPDYQKWQESKKARDAELRSLKEEYQSDEWKGGCYLPETKEEAEERHKQVLADRAAIPWLKKAAQEKIESSLSEMEIARRKCIADLLSTKLWNVEDEPKRLAGGVFTLQICKRAKSKAVVRDHSCPVLVYLGQGVPELPTFVEKFTQKYDFVAYLTKVKRYSGPN